MFDADDVARLRIALARVSRRLDRHSRGGALSGTQASVLAGAAGHGPVRISDLAEFEGINPTMLSRIVAKLEDAGLLHRRPDPEDGRAALVETTEAGLALHHTLRDERTRLLADRLAAMPPDQAARLLAALPALEALAQISTENP
jgi:DNA-binding MarR family transcriptional regulator